MNYIYKKVNKLFYWKFYILFISFQRINEATIYDSNMSSIYFYMRFIR